MHPARWLLAVLPVALLLGTARLPARAQTDTIPPEVAALFDDINDIDKLRVLNPLKLTPDQLEKITALVKQAQTDYNRKLAAAAVPPIRSIAQEIKETRRRMLSGAAVSKDFDDRVKQLQEDFVKRRSQEDKNTIITLSDAIRKTLTKEQVDTAVSLIRKATGKDEKVPTSEETGRYFNTYILQTFIVYPRIVPLLEDMHKAAGSESAHRDTLRRQARR